MASPEPKNIIFLKLALDDPFAFPPLNQNYGHHCKNTITVTSSTCTIINNDDDNNNNNNNNNVVTSRIDNLDDNILAEILSRISPWKHLARCRVVSKRWNSLLSRPIGDIFHSISCKSFTFSLMLLYLPSYSGRSFGTKSYVTSEHPYFRSLGSLMPLDFLPCEQSYNDLFPVASCNDFLLIFSPTFETLYYVCNPLTKKYVAIPHPPSPSLVFSQNAWAEALVGLAVMVQNPSTSCSCARNLEFGLRYRYRVICIVKRRSVVMLMVYSSETGEWRTDKISDPCLMYCMEKIKSTNAVTVNHKLHWFVDCLEQEGSAILLMMDPFRYDDISKIISTICLPVAVRHSTAESITLGVCQGKLRISEFKKVDQNYMLKVWELNDYEQMTWGVVTISMIMDGWTLLDGDSEIIAFHSLDPDVMYLRCGFKLFCCNITNGTMRQVLDYCWHPYRSITLSLVHPVVACNIISN